MKRELGSKRAAELLEKFKPPYWFLAHLHCKFSDLVQNGDGGQVTKFLALDKCIPEKKFLQFLELPYVLDQSEPTQSLASSMTIDRIMTDSGHSTVSYTSISSPERSWDIPDVDRYEDATLQAIEQVTPPLSPTYLPEPIELDEHVPMYVPKPEYPEYLKPPAEDIIVEDQPHADDAIPSPPLHVPSSPPIPYLPLPPPVLVETHALEQDATAALLMLPSTTRRSEVPKADMPPQNRLCFATPITEFKVRESSVAAAAARPPNDLYGFVDTTETEASITCRHARTLHDTERRMMIVVQLVNLRVSYDA
nr:lariat debranching enzyme-like [Tanacetum cinerariifolium]